MIGSATDAEDIVQDVFVKAHQIQLEQMADPKAYLCKMTTNRCLDLLKSARKKRELYTGPWLPEPIHTPVHDSAESVVQKDLLSYAMLVLAKMLFAFIHGNFVEPVLDLTLPAKLVQMTICLDKYVLRDIL